MTDDRLCSQCKAELPPDAPGGLCPACMMKRGLKTNTLSDLPTDWTPPTPTEIEALFPELEILELIGRGGMGAVYKVRQKRLHRLAALKILPAEVARDPSFAERFAREARVLASLNHPNIVTVYDFGDANGRYWFLMEYVDGANLRQMLSAGQITPREALAVVPPICDALQFAHDRGVVHRDIKPENILFDKSGRAKITDFGLAKLMVRDRGDVTLTGSGHALGSPSYMAPEQIEKPQTVDHRADIYSLGVVFYQMLTGELPLGRFAPPSQKVRIDVRLDEVVLKTLEKEPERRYQQVSEVKTRVETIGTGMPPPVKEAVSMSRDVGPATPSPRFSRVALVGAFWLAFAAVLLPIWFLRPHHPIPVGEVHQQTTPLILREALRFLLLALGFSIPLVTTICGAVAVSQIRHSAGRLCGLGLAVFDLLLFPLLVLDAALIAGVFVLLS